MIFTLTLLTVGKETVTKSPIHGVPFPAVTICPETKAQKSIVDITDAYNNLVKNVSTDQVFNETE